MPQPPRREDDQGIWPEPRETIARGAMDTVQSTFGEVVNRASGGLKRVPRAAMRAIPKAPGAILDAAQLYGAERDRRARKAAEIAGGVAGSKIGEVVGGWGGGVLGGIVGTAAEPGAGTAAGAAIGANAGRVGLGVLGGIGGSVVGKLAYDNRRLMDAAKQKAQQFPVQLGQEISRNLPEGMRRRMLGY